MKTIASACAGALLAIFLLNSAPTQAQSKENFEKSRKAKTGFFCRLFSGSEKTKQFTNRQRSDAQRERAEAIWKQQQEFRAEQRQKQLNREPTAWELAYAKQEKQRQKELKKILKARDKRIAARAKGKQKAMATMARYNRKKLRKQQPAQQNTFGPEHFSSFSGRGATAASRKR